MEGDWEGEARAGKLGFKMERKGGENRGSRLLISRTFPGVSGVIHLSHPQIPSAVLLLFAVSSDVFI